METNVPVVTNTNNKKNNTTNVSMNTNNKNTTPAPMNTNNKKNNVSMNTNNKKNNTANVSMNTNNKKNNTTNVSMNTNTDVQKITDLLKELTTIQQSYGSAKEEEKKGIEDSFEEKKQLVIELQKHLEKTLSETNLGGKNVIAHLTETHPDYIAKLKEMGIL